MGKAAEKFSIEMSSNTSRDLCMFPVILHSHTNSEQAHVCSIKTPLKGCDPKLLCVTGKITAQGGIVSIKSMFI